MGRATPLALLAMSAALPVTLVTIELLLMWGLLVVVIPCCLASARKRQPPAAEDPKPRRVMTFTTSAHCIGAIDPTALDLRGGVLSSVQPCSGPSLLHAVAQRKQS